MNILTWINLLKARDLFQALRDFASLVVCVRVLNSWVQFQVQSKAICVGVNCSDDIQQVKFVEKEHIVHHEGKELGTVLNTDTLLNYGFYSFLRFELRFFTDEVKLRKSLSDLFVLCVEVRI